MPHRYSTVAGEQEGTHPLGNANVVAVQVTTRRPSGTLYKKLRLWRKHLKLTHIMEEKTKIVNPHHGRKN
ncbi:hypothetical protein YC2023_114092 [Brassica napus]